MTLRDDEVDHIFDLVPEGMNIWPDLEEGREHFQGRDLTWWRELLGHPRAHPGCCKTCGCATSCLLGVFFDGVVTATIAELGKIGVIPGLGTMDCPRVDAGERHPSHAWIEAGFGPVICDGYEEDE